jgi:cytoskeletal protein CcmA (bactofilin family)
MFSKANNKAETRIETVVGHGTDVEGNLQTAEGLRIDGKVKGSVKAETVIIGQQGMVFGDVTANKVTISGKIEGNVAASTVVDLLPQGQIFGDIRTSKIIIADGARFEGNCHMIKSDGQIIELNPDMIDSDHKNGSQLKVITQQKQKVNA